jgi:hypothetical protein
MIEEIEIEENLTNLVKEEKEEIKGLVTELASTEVPQPIEERKGEDIFFIIPNAPPAPIQIAQKAPITISPQKPVQKTKQYPQSPPFLAKPYPTPKQAISKPAQREMPFQTGLDKINNILLDPAILSIECPGADRPLVANKSGLNQPLNMTLSAEDISKITQYFSEKTRIPLVEGVFKATLGDLLMTAVVSQFIGTRFIIQKKAPNIM